MFANADSRAERAVRLLREALQSNDPRALDAPIALLTKAVRSGKVSDPGRHLTNLCFAYHTRYTKTHQPADLDHAIVFGEQALSAHTRDNPDFLGNMSNLAATYRQRFVRTGVLDDLRRAIALGHEAVAAAAEDDPDRLAFMSNLGIAYTDLYERTADLDDLRRGMDLAEQTAAASGLSGTPDWPGHLATLGAAHIRMYERTHELATLDRAIALDEQALAALPDGHPKRVKPLSDLCIAYRERFERNGQLADCNRALELGKQAYAALPDGHPRRTTPASSLNLAYQRRYERTGDLADLDLAIDFGERSVAGVRESHLSHAMDLSNLSIAFQRRYQRTGVLADLQRAIDLDEQSLAETPDGHPRRAVSLSNLGVGYRDRYVRTNNVADLEHAIELQEQALAVTPDGHPGRVTSLSSLGIAHRQRFERTREPADLERAISLGEQALAAMPEGDAARHMYLSNLHIAYQRLYEHTGDVADSLRGIGFQEQALATLPDDHAGLAVHLSNLGEAYRSLVTQTRQPMDHDKLRMLAERAARTTIASPAEQVWTLYVVGWLANSAGDHQLAVRLLDRATALLSSVPPRESGWSDQEYRLRRYAGLVGESVAAHCATNDPAGAVRAAELGRGVLLAAQLDSRTDLTELQRAHPGLAARFEEVRQGLAEGTDVDDRRALWERHDAVLAEIREVPGFEQFLLPPRLSDLQPAVSGGCVVLVNAGTWRGDAVIVTATSEPVHVRLPDLSRSDVVAHARRLWNVTNSTGIGAAVGRMRVLPEVLSWLWDTIVEPIVATVPVPRVWWMPTGLLGLFPLHAAGHAGRPGALDSVVSSYVPTLRALAQTRSRPPTRSRRQLTVALHHTPGFAELPGTAAEAAHLRTDELLADSAATTDRTTAALPRATWAHFACHATADPTAPSASALHLHDGALALPAISRLNLEQAELAYLSACSTAQLGSQHADESLHLASAFQLAGFRHVIASLWPLADSTAADTARAFYDRLPDTPTADTAAQALHEVVKELRTRHPDRPDLWSPFIHSGP
nr:CHAT domain-containing protein [Kibdelosporangium sp. MJ126-NF4]CEL19816.1 hypothetical protein [Kibdelosporangium sp. MJ126-NF4]CTQ97041.1 hypothetical protein [Kibdelosporangium sp. MJ126-NF4]